MLIILAIYLMWRAFGPGSKQRYGTGAVNKADERPAIKGPDDDEEFLWNIEKNRFKERRAREAEEQKRKEEEQRQRRRRERDGLGADETDGEDEPPR